MPTEFSSLFHPKPGEIQKAGTWKNKFSESDMLRQLSRRLLDNRKPGDQQKDNQTDQPIDPQREKSPEFQRLTQGVEETKKHFDYRQALVEGLRKLPEGLKQAFENTSDATGQMKPGRQNIEKLSDVESLTTIHGSTLLFNDAQSKYEEALGALEKYKARGMLGNLSRGLFEIQQGHFHELNNNYRIEGQKVNQYTEQIIDLHLPYHNRQNPYSDFPGFVAKMEQFVKAEQKVDKLTELTNGFRKLPEELKQAFENANIDHQLNPEKDLKEARINYDKALDELKNIADKVTKKARWGESTPEEFAHSYMKSAKERHQEALELFMKNNKKGKNKDYAHTKISTYERTAHYMTDKEYLNHLAQQFMEANKTWENYKTETKNRNTFFAQKMNDSRYSQRAFEKQQQERNNRREQQ